MPWQCTTCGVLVLADDAPCASCGAQKTAWTVNADRTRTLVVTKRKKLECLRGASLQAPPTTVEHPGIAWQPTTCVGVVSKRDARARLAQGGLPDPRDLLCVRLFPEKQRRWDLTLTVNCAARPTAELALEFEVSDERLDEARSFDVLVLCVHGPDGPEDASELPLPPWIVALDVSDDTALGHAPTLDVAGLRAKPTRLQLGPGGPLVAARLAAPFAARESFARPTGLPTLRALARRMVDDPALHALIVGHASSGADADADRALARRRAEATRDLLTGDVAALRARFDAPPGSEPEWSWAEVQWLLGAARGYDDPCYVGLVDGHPGPVTQRALGSFQLHRGLPVSYDVDEATLERLLREYVDQLGPERPGPERVHVLGGGPWHAPRAYAAEAGEGGAGAEGAALEDADRVDVFLGEGPPSPPREACADAPGGCAAYEAWCARVVEVLPPPDRLPMPLRVVDAFGAPAAGRPLKLLDQDGQALALATTSRTGFVAAEAPPGTYAVEMEIGQRVERWSFLLDAAGVGGFVGIVPYDLRRQPPPPPPGPERPPGKHPALPVPGDDEGPLRLEAFWVLPAPFAERPERPVDLVVPRGMEVALRWEVAGAASLRVEALSAAGVVAPVSIVGDEARHAPDVTTSYTLTATSRDGAVVLARWVNVVVRAPLAGRARVHAQGEWMRVVGESDEG